jgi:hypothetical protein
MGAHRGDRHLPDRQIDIHTSASPIHIRQQKRFHRPPEHRSPGNGDRRQYPDREPKHPFRSRHRSFLLTGFLFHFY